MNGTLWNTAGSIFESGAFIIKCNMLLVIMTVAFKHTDLVF